MYAESMHWAELDANNIVLRVVETESADSLGNGTWVQTYRDTPGQVFAEVGFSYVDGGFRPPQPFPSWTWNGIWDAPVPYPEMTGNVAHRWNEDVQNWILFLPD